MQIYISYLFHEFFVVVNLLEIERERERERVGGGVHKQTKKQKNPRD